MSYQLAVQAFEIRRWDLAKRYLAEELRRNPESAQAYSLLAAIDVNCGDAKSGIEHARTAIELDPNKHHAYYVLGLALMKDKQVFEAEIAMEEAVAMQPSNPTYLTALASFVPLGNRKGMELLDRALAEDPNYVAALHQKYERLMHAKKNSEAEVVRKQVLELDPEDAWMHQNAGWKALSDSNDTETAVDHFREAVRLNPNIRQSVDGLQEAEFQLYNPFAASLKKVQWSKLLLWAGGCFLLSLAYLIGCDSFHFALSYAVFGIGAVGSVLCMLVFGCLWGLSSVIYNVGLTFNPRNPEPLLKRLSPKSPGGWPALLGGIALGALFIFTDAMRQQGKLHIPLPHWLYADWLSIVPSTWRGTAILAPVVFAAAVIGLIWALAMLFQKHARKEPKSTQYFNLILLSVVCTSILFIYGLVAVLGANDWIIFLIVAIELLVIIVPTQPAYREYVKRVIRREQNLTE